MEKPEKDLLAQPPRSKYDHIVDWKFLIQAYIFLGIMITLSSQFMFFWYMSWYANFQPMEIIFSFGVWADGFKHLTKDQITEYFYVGQTVTFISIVYLQIFGNLLSTRTNVKSFFTQAPWKELTRNMWLFGAQLISISILLAIVFLPFCNNLFNTRVPPVQFFFLPLLFCLFVFLFDEFRKLLVRKKLLGFHIFGW
jgi:sodium/potassium-transporting ATPase subunit alpha